MTFDLREWVHDRSDGLLGRPFYGVVKAFILHCFWALTNSPDLERHIHEDWWWYNWTEDGVCEMFGCTSNVKEGE